MTNLLKAAEKGENWKAAVVEHDKQCDLPFVFGSWWICMWPWEWLSLGWDGGCAQKSMFNNRITSLTCIHRKAGIKHNTESEKNEKKGRRKRMEMESEVIKERSAAYLLKKRRPRGGKEWRARWRGRLWWQWEERDRKRSRRWGAGRQSKVFNFFCC